MNRFFSFLAELATRHPWKVLAVWALATAVAIPFSMRLMGRANWWLPRSLDRLLPRVSFGHDSRPQPALVSEE